MQARLQQVTVCKSLGSLTAQPTFPHLGSCTACSRRRSRLAARPRPGSRLRHWACFIGCGGAQPAAGHAGLVWHLAVPAVQANQHVARQASGSASKCKQTRFTCHGAAVHHHLHLAAAQRGAACSHAEHEASLISKTHVVADGVRRIEQPAWRQRVAQPERTCGGKGNSPCARSVSSASCRLSSWMYIAAAERDQRPDGAGWTVIISRNLGGLQECAF